MIKLLHSHPCCGRFKFTTKLYGRNFIKFKPPNPLKFSR
ncbi:hypothetical protein CAMGR0001_1105 [Campylobacter gracilis RM3268]|uniref:Uncharacterized protein n=1 Tax=Campylobacter gracilis RM3268 TaxID=553220 RepID=C8PIQ6_9BACT|nr:hypothetical protein CAMGR0001_1105 [Campylobacter gracilis RM3268]